jgi:16S rRNA (guanine966-N2)-methyltransferase
MAIRFVQRNAGNVGAARDVTVLKLDATMLPAPPLVTEAPCAFAFLDPPYWSALAVPALEGLLRRKWIGTGSVCTVEIGAKEPFAPPSGFSVLDERRYGAARVVFLTVK